MTTDSVVVCRVVVVGCSVVVLVVDNVVVVVGNVVEVVLCFVDTVVVTGTDLCVEVVVHSTGSTGALLNTSGGCVGTCVGRFLTLRRVPSTKGLLRLFVPPPPPAPPYRNPGLTLVTSFWCLFLCTRLFWRTGTT